MTRQCINKVLVAIDGSDRSIETVHYLAAMRALSNSEINLFHVYHKTHDGYYDLAKKTIGTKASDSLKAWETHQHLRIEAYLERCREILLAAGFNSEKIKTTIHHCRQGIARDIVEETGRGYDAVIIRRRGTSSIPALVMGSVAIKLFNAIEEVPLIFAGRQRFNNRILIGMDDPEETLRAVDFVGRMAGVKARFEIGFISVLRRDIWPPEAFTTQGGGVVDQNIFDDEINALFEMAKSKLEEYGFKGENVYTEIVKNAFSRAGAIVDAAERGDYSTIVIGRSRASRMNTFFVGRVSNKIVQIGPKQHFWIVN